MVVAPDRRVVNRAVPEPICTTWSSNLGPLHCISHATFAACSLQLKGSTMDKPAVGTYSTTRREELVAISRKGSALSGSSANKSNRQWHLRCESSETHLSLFFCDAGQFIENCARLDYCYPVFWLPFPLTHPGF